jgi:uncharacterized protein
MSDHSRRLRASDLENSGDLGVNSTPNLTMGEVIGARFNRRDVLRGSLAVTAISATLGRSLAANEQPARKASAGARFDFKEIEAGVDETHHVAEGYDAQVLLRWGDPLFPGAPEFDAHDQSAEKQRRQFGYNTDYVGFLPINDSSDHGLIVANHEYTNEELMFPGVGVQDAKDAGFAKMTKELVDIEIAAHGGSVAEVRRQPNGPWQVVKESNYTRRITADSEMDITGPAAGHKRLRTTGDPSGRRVFGMVNNCAGGVTPWGTWLSAEENFNSYFLGKLPENHAKRRTISASASRPTAGASSTSALISLQAISGPTALRKARSTIMLSAAMALDEMRLNTSIAISTPIDDPQSLRSLLLMLRPLWD